MVIFSKFLFDTHTDRKTGIKTDIRQINWRTDRHQKRKQSIKTKRHHDRQKSNIKEDYKTDIKKHTDRQTETKIDYTGKQIDIRTESIQIYRLTNRQKTTTIQINKQ